MNADERVWANGDVCEVRVVGRPAWRAGSVRLAAGNGRSLAVNIGESLGVAGAFVNTLDECITLLLLKDDRGWRDVASGELVEIRAPGEPAGTEAQARG